MKPYNENHDARQALEALLRDTGEGMSNAEVKVLIAQELNKGDEMDADLVVEAVTEAEAAQQPAFDLASNWAAIEKKLTPQKRARASRKWTLAAAAVMAVFTMITVGTIATEAWRWDFLIEVFRPVANTLGIHLNIDNLGSAGELFDKSPTSDAELKSFSKTIWAEGEVPNTVQGISAKPSWLPQGYAFHSAEVYDDLSESSLTITYRKGASELFVQTVVYAKNDALTAMNVLEKDAKEAEAAKSITITENNGVVNAVRKNNLAIHMVWGRLSREEISQVITSM